MSWHQITHKLTN